MVDPRYITSCQECLAASELGQTFLQEVILTHLPTVHDNRLSPGRGKVGSNGSGMQYVWTVEQCSVQAVRQSTDVSACPIVGTILIVNARGDRQGKALA